MNRFLVFLFLLTLAILSCRKDSILSDHSAKLSFSDDKILFDTIFTTIGSTTKQLKVFNSNNQKIIISSIQLANGKSSNFRLNVNGTHGITYTNVEIAAKDSIFIFVEVTVNPNNANSPMVITDSILFETNGNTQNVDLVAWGQDAYFHYPSKEKGYSVINCGDVWQKGKPHVIYGYAIVAPDCQLTISEGTNIYFHKNSVLLIDSAATLVVNGTLTYPVTFQGDRLEQSYKNLPGQWDRIWLSALSRFNRINYAIIKNGNVGLQIDTVYNSSPTLTLSNTIIENMAGAALYAQGSYIKATNCVFANCGQYLAALTIGGDYSFRHCTFANYWSANYGERKTPSILLTNYYTDASGGIQIRALNNAYFGNCIIYGNIDNELGFDSKSSGKFDYKFDYCLLKTTENTTASNYVNVIKNPADTAIFSNYLENIYELKDNSPAINKGDISITNFSPSIPTDIKGVSRNSDAAPDLGAYEKK